jgi:hypothetical protein
MVLPGADFCHRARKEIDSCDLFVVLPVQLTQDDTIKIFIASQLSCLIP